jgi:hypothetical protein
MYQESPFHYLARHWVEACDRMNLSGLETLAWDDLTVVETDEENEPVLLGSKEAVLAFFQNGFRVRQMIGKKWRTEIEDYHDVQTSELSYSSFRLVRQVDTLDLREKFQYAVTVVWQFTNHEWRAARWHVTRLRDE